MDRNKFFSVVGLGVIGVLFTKIFPIKFTSTKNSKKKNIEVKINPLAVKRKKVNSKNA